MMSVSNKNPSNGLEKNKKEENLSKTIEKKMNGNLPETYGGNNVRKRNKTSMKNVGMVKKPKKDPLMPIDSILSEMDNFEKEKKKNKKKEESDDESGKNLPKSSTPVPGTFKVPTFNDLTRMENDNSIVYKFLAKDSIGVNEMVLAYKMLRGKVDSFNYSYFERTRLNPANIQFSNETEATETKQEEPEEKKVDDSLKLPMFDPDDDQSPEAQISRRNMVKAYLAKHVCKPISEIETYLSEEHWELMGKMKQESIFKVIDQLLTVLCGSTALKSSDGNSGRNSVAMDISSDDGSTKNDVKPGTTQNVASSTKCLPSQKSGSGFHIAPQYNPSTSNTGIENYATNGMVGQTQGSQLAMNVNQGIQQDNNSFGVYQQQQMAPATMPPPGYQPPMAPPPGYSNPATLVQSVQHSAPVYQPLTATAPPPNYQPQLAPPTVPPPTYQPPMGPPPNLGPNQFPQQPIPSMGPPIQPVPNFPPSIQTAMPPPVPRNPIYPPQHMPNGATMPPPQVNPGYLPSVPPAGPPPAMMPPPSMPQNPNYQFNTSSGSGQSMASTPIRPPRLSQPDPVLPPQNILRLNTPRPFSGSNQQKRGGKNFKTKTFQQQKQESPKKVVEQKINMDIIRKMPPPPIPKIIQEQRGVIPATPPQVPRFSNPSTQQSVNPPPFYPRSSQPPPPSSFGNSNGVMRTLFNVLNPGTLSNVSQSPVGAPPNTSFQNSRPFHSTRFPNPRHQRLNGPRPAFRQRNPHF